MQDHPDDKLSDYLDGELNDDECAAIEAHVARCAQCRSELEAMRDLVESARRLGDHPPPADLWSGISDRIGERRAPARRPLLVAAAALVVGIALGVGLASAITPNGSTRSPGPSQRFLLVLYGAPEPIADESVRRELIDRYRAWSEDLHRRGFMELGEKLADDEGFLVRASANPRPVEPSPRAIGGFFLLRADDYQHALRLVRDCPHLLRGGSIELRRIEA